MNMRIKLSIASILIASVLVISCSKDKDEPDNGAVHKVQFKAETSAGGIIQSATYGVDGDAHTDINLSGTTWSSPELTVPAGAYNANVIVNGAGTTDAATMKVQVYVDGKLKKEETANPGRVLSVNITYKF